MNSAFVYLKYCPQLDLYKIGVSKNCKQRNKTLQPGNPFEIVTQHAFESKYPYKVESIMHREFAAYKRSIDDVKLKGEWFNLSFEQADKFISKCENIERSIDFLVSSENYFILK
jgi:hypothetical protein